MLSYLKHLAWCVPVSIAISDLVGCVVRVEGVSMQPTLNPTAPTEDLTLEASTNLTASSIPPSSSHLWRSDWVLVEKVSYKWLHQYQRGDVAVLWAPDDPGQQIIKRVIAVPGDLVVLETGTAQSQKRQETVTRGRCWVEGDNSERSVGSSNLYGQVHLGLLEGRAMCVVWPPWRAGPMPDLATPARGAVSVLPGQGVGTPEPGWAQGEGALRAGYRTSPDREDEE